MNGNATAIALLTIVLTTISLGQSLLFPVTESRLFDAIDLDSNSGSEIDYVVGATPQNLAGY